ncbi:MAG: transketolase family protein [Parcubacteria group bacterium]|nr:transketolase family protein [Parcubacteria group bacterium]
MGADGVGIEKIPTRNGFGEGAVEAVQKNQQVVVLSADLMESTRAQFFKEKFPTRYIEMGVAEQNMASFAAGLALEGKIPFIASYAMFSPGRNWEQIRTTICYNDANVKIVGAHAGVSVGPDGATHQALEDIALMRAMPNMKVVIPCDAIEAKKATMEIAQLRGPVYLRLTREATPLITTDKTPFVIGRAEVIYTAGDDALIVACGPLLYNALKAAVELFNEGIKVKVVNCHTIKPLSEDVLLGLADACRAVVSVEEHQIYGGLGSALAELFSKNRPVIQEFVGVNDNFGASGKPEELIEHFGLGVSGIKNAVHKAIERKKR